MVWKRRGDRVREREIEMREGERSERELGV